MKRSKIKLPKWLLIIILIFCEVKTILIEEYDMLVENNIQGLHLVFLKLLNKSLYEEIMNPQNHMIHN